MMTFTENEEKVLKDVWSEAIPLLEYVSVTCDVIGKLFVAPPDQAGLSSMSSMEIDQEIEEVGSTNIVKGMRLIAAFGRQDDPAQSILNAIADHSRLFVGPMHLFAPPWSSIYLDIGMLNGPSAQAVAETYRRNGVQISSQGSEPADHIAYELTFVAELCRRIRSSVDTQDYDQAAQSLLVIQGFCSEHLSKWIEPFCDRVQNNAQTDLYRGLALLARGVVNLTTLSVSRICGSLGLAAKDV
jgi:TorA maturation chaperone TorD